MADYLTTDTELTSVANAIRTKGGTSASLVYPTGFVTAIQNIPSGGGGTDVSDTTAVAGDVLTGKYFHIADGTKVQGTIASKTSSDVTTSNNVVTIPAGHYAYQVQKTVGTAQAAYTFHPSSSDRSIASGKYLTGTQTIKGVRCSNLTASIIKKDVTVMIGDSEFSDSVMRVTGTYEGGGGGSSVKHAVFEWNGSSFEQISGDTFDSRDFALSQIIGYGYNSISQSLYISCAASETGDDYCVISIPDEQACVTSEITFDGEAIELPDFDDFDDGIINVYLPT